MDPSVLIRNVLDGLQECAEAVSRYTGDRVNNQLVADIVNTWQRGLGRRR